MKFVELPFLNSKFKIKNSKLCLNGLFVQALCMNIDLGLLIDFWVDVCQTFRLTAVVKDMPDISNPHDRFFKRL